jgi:hypothetical protein
MMSSGNPPTRGATFAPMVVVLDQHRDGRPFVMGDAVSIADFALAQSSTGSTK